MCNDLFKRIESLGVDFDRLSTALSQRDNWGELVHSFEYLTVLGCVEDAWRLRLMSQCPHDCPMCDGPMTFDQLEGGYPSWVCDHCGRWHIAKDCCEDEFRHVTKPEREV